MEKLDHNVEAYRQAATALDRLRALIRRHLEADHGAEWEKAGIPDDPGEYLAQRRARESSVKWNPTSSTDLLDFAGFVNLHDILNVHPRLREGFARLVPEPQALRLRFLELDTVLNRIAYARPVSDSDLELLLGFDERLRQLISELAPEVEVAVGAASPPPAWSEPKRSARQSEQATAPAASAPPPPPPPPRAQAQAKRHEAGAPSRREPAPEPAERPSRQQPGPAPATAAPGTAGTSVREAREESAPPKDLETALKRGDDGVVLNALYQEITGLAEKLWGDSAVSRAPIWEKVSESTWYRDRFSPLRLRVVSDFYDLLRAIQEKRAAGSSRADLHELLKDRNFAQLLMDLREFFRPFLAPARPGQRS